MNTRWKPNVTVAAVIEQDGRFLLVEEETADGLRLNNPAGHLDCGETPEQACTRETLEETAYSFTPGALVGIYLSRQINADGRDTTYLRFAYCGTLGTHDTRRKLDKGIVRTLWLTADEIRASIARHRSPVLVQSMNDYLRGTRYPLALVQTDISVTQTPRAIASKSKLN
jgi:ADP-ribose pyrophosphatase YjhB (NUDIX family)